MLGNVSVVENVVEGVRKKILFGHGIDRLNVTKPFACMFTIGLSFTAIRTWPIWIHAGLVFYFISYLIPYKNVGAYTCICHKKDKSSSIDNEYIYFTIAVVFTMVVSCMLFIVGH